MVMEVLNQGEEEEEIGISEGPSSQTDIWGWLLSQGLCDPDFHKRDFSKEREAGAQRDKGRIYWKEEKGTAE